MKTSDILVRLCWLVVALALVAAAAGLFWPAAGTPFTHTAVHKIATGLIALQFSKTLRGQQAHPYLDAR